MKEEEIKERAFLLELRDLTLKHRIAIGGCGCCDSPWLKHGIDLDPRAGYVRKPELQWVSPKDVDWKNIKDEVIK